MRVSKHLLKPTKGEERCQGQVRKVYQVNEAQRDREREREREWGTMIVWNIAHFHSREL